MDFDIDAARKAGYSDQEIADHLSQVANFDAGKARQSGYSDQEIIQHLSHPSVPAVNNPAGLERPSLLESLGAGLNDVYQGIQYAGNKLGSLAPGAVGRYYAQNEAARVAEQQSNEQAYQHARQVSGDVGQYSFLGQDVDPGRLQGNIIGMAPLGGVAGTGIRAAGGAAELAGLGSTTGGTGLAGFLNTLGTNVAGGGAGLGLGQRVAANALEGGTQGAIVGGGQGNAAEGAAAGTAAGGILPIIGAPLGAVARKVGPTLADWFSSAYNAARGQPTAAPTGAPGVNGAALDASLAQHGLDVNTLSPKTKANLSAEASKQADALGQADPDALARGALLDELGLTKTNGMVSRNPIEWAQEREQAKDQKFGTPLMNAFTGNMRKINAGLSDLTEQTGGDITTAHNVGNQIADAVNNRYAELGKGISAEYKNVRDNTGQDLASNGQNLVAAMGPLSDTVAGSPLVDSVTKRMTRMGLMDKEGNLTGSTLNNEQSEELRKFINQNIDQRDPGSMWAGRQLLNAHDQDVADGASGDAFANARQLFKDRQNEFDNTPHQAILNGRTAPEDIVNRYLVNGKVDDVAALKNTLQQTPEGQQAWDNARAHVADWIHTQATGDKGADGLTFDRFNRAVNAIGPEKMQALFPDTANNYQQWLKGTQLTSMPPGESPVNRSNTTSALLNALKMAGGIPEPHTFAARMAVEKGVEALKGSAQKRAVNAALEGTAVTPSDVAASQALRKSAQPQPTSGLSIPSTLAGLLGLSATRPSENASP